MAIPKILGAQRDFTFGEVDIALKRADDHPARKAGLRQMLNNRILNSGAIQNRSGRRALFPFTNGLLRIEKFTISAGNNFKISFAPNIVQISNDVGSVVAVFSEQGNGALLPWVSQSDVDSIRYSLLGLSIYITFGHTMRPQVISWDGVSTWSIADFTEIIYGSGQKRTLFYRISPQGITLLPGARTGSGVSLVASAPLFVAGHVGTRMRFVNRQMLITGVTNSTNATVTIEETLPGHQGISTGSVDPTSIFSVGDEIVGGTSGSKGIVTAVTYISSTGELDVQLITTNETTSTSTGTPITVAFQANETMGGPGGSAVISTVTAINNPVAGVTDWDDEVMNSLQGYPASCFVDQFRLGFCNFPTVPGGIAWSAINSPTDLYVAVTGDNAIFEITPDKVTVQDVVPGPESSEFVFCDKKLYYVPITPTNPLVPGGVSFNLLSSDGAANVQPRPAQEIILYANAGGNAMMAVVATGAYFRPFNTRVLSKYHQHLFNGITAIAVPTADGQFTERYAYVLNSNNSLVVGKYTSSDMTNEEPKIGWGPWNGGGTVDWVSAWTNEVYFTSNYFGAGVCERLDDTLYLDCALFVNAPPAPFVAPAGKGPLWFIPSRTVTLMDQGTRAMGTYQIDANGFIIPQFNGGENLEAATLVAGQPWTGIAEPFVPDAQPGNSVHQRMFKRRVSRMAVYVVNSTGFLMARLFSGPITPTSPALGTVMNTHRVTTWNQGDNPTLPPPLREIAERWRPLGRSFDPRVAIIKDTPGPLQILEIGMEASI